MKIRAVPLVSLLLAAIIVVGTTGPASADLSGHGSGKKFDIAGSVFFAAGGVDSKGRADPSTYRYLVKDQSVCKDNQQCRLGHPDVCAGLYRVPGDDFRLSSVYRRRMVPPPPGGWEYLAGSTGCLNYRVIQHRPVITMAMVRQRVQKLLPRAAWAHQPPEHKDALVNFPVLFAVQTPQDVAFRPFTIIGQTVTATAHVRDYSWDFGDGTRGDYDWPGRTWVPGDHCDQHACDGYISHIYEQTGTLATRPTLLWSVHFRVDDGPDQPIPGDMRTIGPVETVHLVESHGVLVGPGDH